MLEGSQSTLMIIIESTREGSQSTLAKSQDEIISGTPVGISLLPTSLLHGCPDSGFLPLSFGEPNAP